MVPGVANCCEFTVTERASVGFELQMDAKMAFKITELPPSLVAESACVDGLASITEFGFEFPLCVELG